MWELVGGGFTQAGYDALASFLRKDAKQLKVLDVTISGTSKPWETDGIRTEDLQCMFIESIQTPSKLELLTLRDSYHTHRYCHRKTAQTCLQYRYY